ncbi:hypothetical protein [Methylobacterium sp. A52T]
MHELSCAFERVHDNRDRSLIEPNSQELAATAVRDLLGALQGLAAKAQHFTSRF